MLDGRPIEMAVLSKPNNVWVASASAVDQETEQFIARIEDRIGAHCYDLSKGDETVAPPPPLGEAILGRRALPIPAAIHRRPSPHRQTKSREPARH
jgi:hypothetical protein